MPSAASASIKALKPLERCGSAATDLFDFIPCEVLSEKDKPEPLFGPAPSC